MTDITIRLRRRKEQEIMEDGYVRVEWEDEDAMEAADEIERLRAALQTIAYFEEKDESLRGWYLSLIKRIALIALEEGKE
jgi:hypothetical protein